MISKILGFNTGITDGFIYTFILSIGCIYLSTFIAPISIISFTKSNSFKFGILLYMSGKHLCIPLKLLNSKSIMIKAKPSPPNLSQYPLTSSSVLHYEFYLFHFSIYSQTLSYYPHNTLEN